MYLYGLSNKIISVEIAEASLIYLHRIPKRFGYVAPEGEPITTESIYL